MTDRALRPAFERFPFRDAPQDLRAWTRGRTGYPIVDAGMRQLWTTGWMHNRVRLIAASFLVKHLLIDWREGERWFWDTLVDADPANNPASWQWDRRRRDRRRPLLPHLQPRAAGGEVRPRGRLCRRWVPELAAARRHIHAPGRPRRRRSPPPASSSASPTQAHRRPRLRPQRALAALKT
jgi:deoxyribodipyrimidine photo-lyase